MSHIVKILRAFSCSEPTVDCKVQSTSTTFKGDRKMWCTEATRYTRVLSWIANSQARPPSRVMQGCMGRRLTAAELLPLKVIRKNGFNLNRCNYHSRESSWNENSNWCMCDSTLPLTLSPAIRILAAWHPPHVWLFLYFLTSSKKFWIIFVLDLYRTFFVF